MTLHTANHDQKRTQLTPINDQTGVILTELAPERRSKSKDLRYDHRKAHTLRAATYLSKQTQCQYGQCGRSLRTKSRAQNKANSIYLPNQHQLIYPAPASILPAQHHAWACSRNDPLLLAMALSLSHEPPESAIDWNQLRCP